MPRSKSGQAQGVRDASISFKAPPAAQIHALQRTLESMRESGDRVAMREAQRWLPWIAIAKANTPAERHDAIKRLPVTIVVSRPADGRHGIVKTYVAKGKARSQRFVAGVEAGNDDDELGVRVGGGPRVETLRTVTGRWKTGTSGSCYWDSEDDGPDQCSPISGRWKANGSECYFDDNDSGPDQCDPVAGRWTSDGNGGCQWNDSATGEDECEPSGSTCYSDGQPDTCATEQDIDDAEALLSAAQAEVELMQDQNEDLAAAYCNEYPQECGSDYSVQSGPSMQSCFVKLQAAAVATGASLGVIGGGFFALRVFKLGATATILIGTVGAVAAVIAAGAIYSAYTCYYPSIPAATLALPEPEYL